MKALEFRAEGKTANEVAKATGFHAAYVTQLVLLLRKKIGKKRVAEEIGDSRWMMLQFAHERVHLVRNIPSRIGQLSRMNRALQSVIQVFVRIVFRGIRRKEKHLDFLLVFFQPGGNKLAMVDLCVSP